VLDGLRALGEDDRARGVELDLRGLLDALQIGGPDRVEGRVRVEEIGDLVHRPHEIYQCLDNYTGARRYSRLGAVGSAAA
jgi:hypothetical protein